MFARPRPCLRNPSALRTLRCRLLPPGSLERIPKPKSSSSKQTGLAHLQQKIDHIMQSCSQARKPRIISDTLYHINFGPLVCLSLSVLLSGSGILILISFLCFWISAVSKATNASVVSFFCFVCAAQLLCPLKTLQMCLILSHLLFIHFQSGAELFVFSGLCSVEQPWSK